MVDVNKAAMIMLRITECYQAAQRLFGDQYKEKTKGIRDAMQDFKDKYGCSNVEAGLAVIQFMENKNEGSSMLIMLVSAVVYDMAEEINERR